MSPRAYLTISEDILVVTRGGGKEECYWLPAGRGQRCSSNPLVHKIAPLPQKKLAQNVSSTKVEKPCSIDILATISAVDNLIQSQIGHARSGPFDLN